MSIAVVPVTMTTPEVRTRTACRAKVTRVKNHITAILQNESEYSAQELIVELEDNLSELDKRIQELDEADTACLDLIETEEEIESTVEECSNLRRLARQVRSKVILKLKILNLINSLLPSGIWFRVFIFPIYKSSGLQVLKMIHQEHYVTSEGVSRDQD